MTKIDTLLIQHKVRCIKQKDYDKNFWINSYSLSYIGASTALGYDNDGLLTSLNGLTIARHPLHGLPTQVSNSKRTYDYGLTYNLIGQITGKTETLADGTNNTFVYGYDDKRRLISVLKNNIQIESYDYDANGNRELKSSAWSGITDQVATFNIADQQQSDGDTQFEYDTNGRLSKKLNPINGGTAIEEYSYSSQGRLLSVIFKQADQITNVTTTIKTITYKHNALGNRVAKLVDGSVFEKYLWLDKTTLLATYDQNNSLKQRFEYGLSHTPVKFTQNSTTYYINSDHLGSPRTITDESGSVIKALDYDSFGNVISDSNEGFEIPFGFAGGLKDSDTQLLRFGYRDYDPQIGRWTARDPIGFAGGDTNLYGYVASDPVNWIDPDGKNGLAIGLVIGTVWYAGTQLKSCASGAGKLEESKKMGDDFRDYDALLKGCISGTCTNEEIKRYTEGRYSSLNQGVDTLREAAWELGTSTPHTSLSGAIPTSGLDVIVSGVVGEAASQ
jgi:RHS repeat-associated protein